MRATHGMRAALALWQNYQVVGGDYQVMDSDYRCDLHITQVADGNYPGNVNYPGNLSDYPGNPRDELPG